jgi:hypothetical protein
LRLVKRLLPAAALALVYLWAFPYFARLRSANELPRVLLSQEMVRRGTFRLDARMGELGSTFDIATTPAPARHRYSNKAPGVSLLGAPVMVVADAVAGGKASVAASTWALRVFVVTLPCLLFLWGLWRLAGRMTGGNVAAQRTVLVAYALGSMALPYGILFFSHALAAACAGGAFVLAVRLARDDGAARRDAAAVACGALAGMALLVDYQALLASAAVGVYLLWRARPRWRVAGLALLGSLPPVLALLAYHQACYGSPFRTGYSFAADVAHEQGVLGIIGPNREAMWNALLAPDNGLIVLTPWVLLAVLGGAVVWRDRGLREKIGAETAVCAAVVAAYVLFVASLVPEFGRAGWSVGPRYIGVAMPFLAWLAAPGVAWCFARPAPRVIAGLLVVSGVLVHVLAATTWPHWPTSFENPLHEVSLRALGEGLAPHSIGTALGLRGVLSLLPLFAAVAGLVLWALGVRPRRTALATAVACALAVGLVAAYAGFPATPAADREQRWRYVKTTWEP